MKATFTKTKDIGFDKSDGSGRMPARALTTPEGTTYKLYGNKSKDVDVGTEYEFEAEDGKIDGKTFRPAGEPKSSYQKQDDGNFHEKQTSIETQNAVTNVCNLIAAGVLPLDSLLGRNVIPYLESKLIIGSHKAQVAASPVVQAAIEMGGVVKPQFPNIGAFLNKCWSEHGLQRPDVEAITGPITPETDFEGAYVCLVTELEHKGKHA